MSQETLAIVIATSVILGIAIQLFLFGNFAGKISERISTHSRDIDDLKEFKEDIVPRVVSLESWRGSQAGKHIH